ncbi:MAG: hypothetical protein ABIQ12_11905 [Opitutaceae bacterium]
MPLSNAELLKLTRWNAPKMANALGQVIRADPLRLPSRTKPVRSLVLAGCSTAPTIRHWPGRAQGDLRFGTGDGPLYFVSHPKNASLTPGGN